MTTKDDKSGSEKKSFSESSELFEGIFRKELAAFEKEKQKKEGIPPKKKTESPKKGKAAVSDKVKATEKDKAHLTAEPRPPKKEKAAVPDKAKATEKDKAHPTAKPGPPKKEKTVPYVKAGSPKKEPAPENIKVAPPKSEENESLIKLVREDPIRKRQPTQAGILADERKKKEAAPPPKDYTPRQDKPPEVAKTPRVKKQKTIETAKRFKILGITVLSVVLLTILVQYLGILDLRKLVGFSELPLEDVMQSLPKQQPPPPPMKEARETEIKKPEIPKEEEVKVDAVKVGTELPKVTDDSKQETVEEPHYPYSILLASHSTAEYADKALAMHRKEGVSAFWVKVDLGKKGVWYRVFSGHFRDVEEAEDYVKQKKLVGAKAKHTKYATLIGRFDKKEELNIQLLDLQGFGYSPYVIQEIKGAYLLYVGAFYTKVGAEKQQAELASRGIQSKVAER